VSSSFDQVSFFSSYTYFRDEGVHEDDKRLCWIELSSPDKLISFVEDTGLGHFNQNIIRWTKEEGYRIAIFGNSLKFDGELIGGGGMEAPPADAFAISCVSAKNKDIVQCVGESGLFSIDHEAITPLVRFRNTVQLINTGKFQSHFTWTPTHILPLNENTYFIGGHWGGCYLLKKGKTGAWAIESLDDIPAGRKDI
jgi:hypothetical protein